MLDQCSDTCGWIAGFIAAISFGTFGVPIRSTKAKLKVDPLVMQSYKSLLCFLTCWLVIPLGEPFKFTPWGIVSGIFWVPGATAGIYGIQNAGLAVSVGTWSSIIVMSSFCWGILVFHEGVKSKFHALLACIILIFGLIGMSVYSAPVDEKDKTGLKKKSAIKIITSPVYINENIDEATGLIKNVNDESNIDGNEAIVPIDIARSEMSLSLDDELQNPPQDLKIAESIETNEDIDGVVDIELVQLNTVLNTENKDSEDSFHNIEEESPIDTMPTAANKKVTADFSGGKIVKRRKNVAEDKHSKSRGKDKSNRFKFDYVDSKDQELVHFCGRFSLTKRQLGLVGAIINGVWGSNSMIPMHYARAQGFYGAGYLISYSVGSMIVTVVLWLLRYLVNLYLHKGDFKKALHALPSFHFRTLWFPGSMAGFLYSLGNFCSIITVTALGQGVGYSFVQTSMLISGIWGIFYFGEVKGSERIFKWLLSSLVTLIGILSLSYEHQGSTAHRLI